MLKKDLIELCLLHVLSVEDLYGYEILRRIHESFPGTQESGIYALLRQYQDRRIVTIFRSRRETEQWLKHLSAKNTVP